MKHNADYVMSEGFSPTDLPRLIFITNPLIEKEILNYISN
jgi:hypothetical protein